MFQYSICAFLAPVLVSAAAFPWALPEPTFVIPAADNWSPAPTEGPAIGVIELFKRADEDNTCGYISGEQSRSLTCNNPSYVCATNTYYGVHGCCDPNAISTCSIPTTCIPSSLMSASCTDAACSTNDYIAKCTDSSAPYCYEWRYVYSTRTVMTEHGCDSSAFTISVERTYEGDVSSSLPSEVPISVSVSVKTVTASAGATTTSDGNAQSATASPTSTAASQETKKKSTNIGAIVGGVVGGLVILGAFAFGIVFLILRNRKNKQHAANAAAGVNQPMMGGPAPGVTEYKPQPGGYPSPGQQYPPTAGGYYGQENKPWQQQGAPYGSPPTSPAPQYTGPTPVQPVPFGVAEAGGTPIPGHPQQQPPQQQVYEAP